MADRSNQPSGREVSHAIMAVTIIISGTTAFCQDNTTLAKRGESLLAANCSRCHEIGQTGASPHNDAPPFRTLARKYQIEALAEALAEGLSVGHPDMPVFVFEPDEVGAILEYLKSIQQP